MQGNQAEELAVAQVEVAEAGGAEPHCIREHYLEHRLELARRTRDNLQDLRGCRLLLQRLGKLARARLRRLEQLGVLDRDHRLGCEGFKQPDLVIGERSTVQATNDDRADGNPLRQQRRRQNGTIAKTLRQGV